MTEIGQSRWWSKPLRVTTWWGRLLIGRNPAVTVVRLVVLVALSFVLFKGVLIPVRVTGRSMEPTYRDGRVNFINRLAYHRGAPQRGDVVGLRRAPSRLLVLKRIVGMPGERVSIRQGEFSSMARSWKRTIPTVEPIPPTAGERTAERGRVLRDWDNRDLSAYAWSSAGISWERSCFEKTDHGVGRGVAGGGRLLGLPAGVPPDRVVIRRQLQELAQDVSSRGEGASPLAALAGVNRLLGYFTGDVEIRLGDIPGARNRIIQGRDELRELVAGSRASSRSMSARLQEVYIERIEAGQALVQIIVAVRVDGDEIDYIQELRLELVKEGRSWLIRRVEPVAALGM